MSNLICFHDVSFAYALAPERMVLSHISWEIPSHSITVVCGSSGSGKTTLLRLLKQEIIPAGQLMGEITSNLTSREIAIVFQNPDSQLVCGTVREDLVFSMENLGFSRELMRKRLAETVSFFGIESLLDCSPEELSGGQKQLIALCGAMMTYPKLLVLDEPLSQLDPIAREEFIGTLQRIHEEFSITIVMSEHRLQEVLPLADNLCVLQNGRIVKQGEAVSMLTDLLEDNVPAQRALVPDLVRASLCLCGQIYVTPQEVRRHLPPISPVKQETMGTAEPTTPALCCKNISYAYPAGDRYVLKRLSLSFSRGKLSCVFGGNGSGKSTLLKLIAGILPCGSGKIKKNTDICGYVPQNIRAYFMQETIQKEIWYDGCDKAAYNRLIEDLDLSSVLLRNPYDVSGGEAERVALASVLLRNPSLILLDEPTKGLDPGMKDKAAQLLHQSGATVIMATHDLEFAASFSDECYFLFDGELAYQAPPREFFKDNRYYTTPLHRAFFGICNDVITYEDVDGL